jgi:hydrogenase maturation protease
MPRVLVICIGNTLRSDDGFAWHVADELDSQPEEGRRVLKVHQLTPELADAMNEVALVIFVDAAMRGDPGEMNCTSVTTSHADLHFSHDLTPAVLLGMAKTLYAKEPRAFLISAAGKSFGHGETLSPEIATAIPLVLTRIRKLANAEGQ